MQIFKIASILLLFQMQLGNFHVLGMDSEQNYRKYQQMILKKHITKNKEIALEKINNPENASDFFKCYGWLKIIPMQGEDINIIVEELLPLNFTCKDETPKQSKKKERAAYKKILLYFAYRLHRTTSSIKIYCSPLSRTDKLVTLQYLTKKYAAELTKLEPEFKNYFTQYQQ